MIRRSLAVSVLALLVPVALSAHSKPAQTETPPKAIHIVQPGESLSLLAKRYGVSVRALAQANRLATPHLIRAGQTLVIPDVQNVTLDKADRPKTRTPRPPARFVLEKPEFASQPPEFIWPVEGPVSSSFGRRRGGWHTGIDIKAEVGTPVFAAAPGTVYYSGWEKRYGRVVKIQHVDEFVTIYAHNLQVFVKVGDEVYAGQVIGTVGRTGRASAHHLHFEIRNQGKVYNPLFLLPTQEVRAEPDETAHLEDGDEP